MTLFAAWVSCLLFTCGWYRRWGGWTSNAFTLTATCSAVLPFVLLAWSASGLSPDEHLRRLLRVRGYVLAMCVRMLLLVNFSAVLAVMGKYLVELRDYPRDVAGWVMAPAAPAMAASTLLTTVFHRRALRPFWLLVGVVWNCRQPLVALGHRQLHAQGASWPGASLAGACSSASFRRSS